MSGWVDIIKASGVEGLVGLELGSRFSGTAYQVLGSTRNKDLILTIKRGDQRQQALNPKP